MNKRYFSILIVLIFCFFISLVSASTWGENANLTAYYDFNESSGTVVYDFSGNMNNGEIIGTVQQGVAGKLGNAYNFTGEGNISVVDLDEIINYNHNFSLSFWINNPNNQAKQIFRKGTVFNMFTDSSGYIWITTKNGQNSYIPDYRINDSELKMITLIYDSSTENLKGYYNNQSGTNLDFSINPTGFNFTSESDLIIGSNWKGIIDEFSIYDKALTEEEIAIIYNSGNGINPTNSTITINSPTNNEISHINQVTFNASSTVVGATLVNSSLWTNETGSWEQRNTTNITGISNISTFIREFSHEDIVLWNIQFCDSDGDCAFESTNYTFSVALNPNITLNTPLDNYYSINRSLNFLGNVSSYENITNYTFNIYHDNGTLFYQSTNSSITAGTKITNLIKTLTNFITDIFYWNFEVCDSLGTCASALANYTLNLVDLDYLDSSSETLTFTQNESKLRYVNIFKDANVTSAKFNLSGNDDICYQESVNIINQTGIDGDCDLNYSGVYSGTCLNIGNGLCPESAWDGNWSTYNSEIGDFYINYSKPIYSQEAILQVGTKGASLTLFNFTIPDSCFSYYDDKLALYLEPFNVAFQQKVLVYCYNGSFSMFGQTTYSGSLSSIINEEAVYWVIGNISNASLEVGHQNETYEWSYSGIFNQTDNQTEELRDNFMSILNSGACDCEGCFIDNLVNCSIPILFHSDSAGILKVEPQIIWTEYINPNITVIQPIGEKTSTNIIYIINATDNYALKNCKYWVTRGASIEVSNTTVSCADQITGTLYVSSIGTDYIFHAYVEDYFGYSNYSNSSFSTSSTAIIVLPPSAGGGGSTTSSEDSGWTMEVGNGVAKFEADMSKGQTREFNLQFENLGTSSRTITLSCEDVVGLACQYIEFTENPFELALLKDTKQTISFKINLPKNMEIGDYQFNIKALDDQARQGAITMFLGVGTLSLIPAFINKILLDTSDWGLPYWLIFIPVFIGVWIFSARIFFKKKFPFRPIWLILTSTLIAVLSVSFI